MSSVSRWKTNVWLILGLAISNVLVLSPVSAELKLLGGTLLFCLLPGLALVDFLFRSRTLDPLTRLLLSASISYVLSNLIVLVLTQFPGGIGVGRLVVALDITIVALIIARALLVAETGEQGKPWRKEVWLYIVVLLVILCLFRFLDLGYSDFDTADETPIFLLATKLIAGNGSAILEHPKGPVEITTALAYMLFGDSYSEFALRFPFALASVISGLMLYLLGKAMFSARTGFIAAILLALDGIYLSETRWAQYQGVVLLMAVATIYCFWRATSTVDRGDRDRFLILGSVFFAFGCLTHYGGILVLPASALLYLTAIRSTWKRALPLVLLSALVVLGIDASFYVPFFLLPHLAGVRSYYFEFRLGWGSGIYNNLQQFLDYLIYPNSTYYVAFMWLTFFGALALLWKQLRIKWLASLVVASTALGLLVSAIYPALFQVGSANFAFVWFTPILIILAWGKDLSLASRTIWVWFMTGFLVLTFFAREPMTHWYFISPAWTLLSACALDAALSFAEGKLKPSVRWVIWVPLALLVALFSGYLYVFFLQREPEYAGTFPNNKSPLYWTLQTRAPLFKRVAAHGTPYHTGWKVIGYLYRTGGLRGPFRNSTGSSDNPEWFIGQQWDWDEASKYIIYDGVGKKKMPGYSLPEIEQFYNLAGRVLVNGAPTLLVYQRKDSGPIDKPSDFNHEEYEPLYDQLASLDEPLRDNEVGAGSKTYFQAAGLVEATSKPGDAIVFTEPGQVRPFSFHYSGSLPYRVLTETVPAPDLDALSSGGRVYTLLWTSPNGKDRENWDAWLSKQKSVSTHAWQGTAGLALSGQPGAAGLQLLQEARLGDGIDLLGYQLAYLPEKKAVSVTLYWSASAQQNHDYTVFTHLVDRDAHMWGQKDNQPVAGSSQTSAWRTDKVVQDEYEIPLNGAPAGEYWVDVGMYDALTGERLPASGQGATPDRSLRLPVSVKVS